MALYLPAVYKPVKNHSGDRTAHQGFVVHVQVGDGSCYSEFDNPVSQASSHFWISKLGVCEQYVDTDLIAWAEMAGNGDYISCEFEGLTTEQMTPAQLAEGAKLIAWCAEQDGFPLTPVDHGGHGVTTHCHYPSGVPDVAWGDHSCPGPLRLAQIPALIAAAIPPPSAPSAATGGTEMTAYDPVTGGSWTVRADGSVFTADNAPYLGGLNNHPEYNAVADEGPAVGIAAFGVGGTGGYVIVCDKPGNSTPAWYRFPRDGSLAKS